MNIGTCPLFKRITLVPYEWWKRLLSDETHYILHLSWDLPCLSKTKHKNCVEENIKVKISPICVQDRHLPKAFGKLFRLEAGCPAMEQKD